VLSLDIKYRRIILVRRKTTIYVIQCRLNDISAISFTISPSQTMNSTPKLSFR